MSTPLPLATNAWVDALHAYTPGEQPTTAGWIKLNTNENPYPPAPAVLEAIVHAATESHTRKYPDPACSALRQALAAGNGVTADEILVGNGSDEILRLIFHGFLPATGAGQVAVLNPTYSLYDTLAGMFGGQCVPVAGPPGADVPLPDALVDSDAPIAVLANPNPPYGTLYSQTEMERLAKANAHRLVVIDEAYVDFAGGESALPVYRQFSNVVISRTFSKSASLAGMRVGYLIARPEVVQHLWKIKDSYNVNAVSQAAALAAVQSAEYYATRTAEIVGERKTMQGQLEELGFHVEPSAGNFLFARRADAADLLQKLKAEKILVRYFATPALKDGLRITIGLPEENARLIEALRGFGQG